MAQGDLRNVEPTKIVRVERPFRHLGFGDRRKSQVFPAKRGELWHLNGAWSAPRRGQYAR